MRTPIPPWAWAVIDAGIIVVIAAGAWYWRAHAVDEPPAWLDRWSAALVDPAVWTLCAGAFLLWTMMALRGPENAFERSLTRYFAILTLLWLGIGLSVLRYRTLLLLLIVVILVATGELVVQIVWRYLLPERTKARVRRWRR